MPNILYLSYDGLSDPLGQSQIIPYLNGLAKNGFKIYVISFEKGVINQIKNTGLNPNINWLPLAYHKSPPIIGTLWDIFKLNKLATSISKQYNITIVHCRSYITSIIGLRIKQKLGLKFIFDMRGFWADERIEGGIWNIKKPLYKIIYKFFKHKERNYMQSADHIISLTQTAKEEIITNKALSVNRKNLNESITVIPTCVDTALFNPSKISESDQNKLRVELELNKDDYLLLYLGSIGTWYMLDEMLDYFIVLKKQKDNARFLFLTSEKPSIIENSYKNKCTKLGTTYNSKHLIIRKVERTLVPLHISICHSSVFFIRPTYSKKASSATKMGEILAMGKPIITNTGWGDIDNTITQSVGQVIKIFTSEQYEVVFKKILNTSFNSHSIRSFSIGYFDLGKGIKNYTAIYEDLIKS